MSASHSPQQSTPSLLDMDHHLTYLKRPWLAAQSAELATQAAQQECSHGAYLARLMEGEADWRRDRATKSRMRLARFPSIKPLDQFRWAWPTRINRLQVQHHFHLGCIKANATLLCLGGVGP
jgi:DNA replication protein DnaC